VDEKRLLDDGVGRFNSKGKRHVYAGEAEELTFEYTAELLALQNHQCKHIQKGRKEN